MSAFEGIHTAPRSKPMLKMVSAILQIPTAGSARTVNLKPPKPYETFLHEVFLQRGIGRQTCDNLSKGLTDSTVFD
jgi:hypothetical protein